MEETFPLLPKCVGIEVLLWLSQGAIHSAEAPLLWNVSCCMKENGPRNCTECVCDPLCDPVCNMVHQSQRQQSDVFFFFIQERNVYFFRKLECFLFFKFCKVQNLEIVTQALHDLKIFNKDWRPQCLSLGRCNDGQQ